jgi:hypothetical protein
MGLRSTPRSAGKPALRRTTKWLAAAPLLVACTLAAVMLDGALAPAHEDREELRLQRSPSASPPPERQPARHEEVVYDPSEMISV